MKQLAKQTKEKIKELAKQYTPSWQYGQDGDIGTVFADLFLNRLEENQELLETMQKRHQVFYLNLFDISKRANMAASGLVSFAVTTEDGVSIKKGTKVGTKDGITYVTQNDFVAVKPKMKALVYTEPDYQSFLDTDEDSFLLFDRSKENLKEVCFYLAKKDVCQFENSGTVELRFVDVSKREGADASFLLDENNTFFEYLTEEGKKSFSCVEFSNGIFTLKADSPLPITTYQGIESIWICCSIKDTIELPLVSKKSFSLSSRAEELLPECLYSNDTELTKTNFYPFGEEFNVYDCFYIRSNECFSKKGSIVTLSFWVDFEGYEQGLEDLSAKHWKTIMPTELFKEKEVKKIFVEKVSFEYWNDQGWSRLFPEEDYSDIFASQEGKKVKLSFVCPSDFAPVYIGADVGLYLRCRIQRLTPGYYQRTLTYVPFIRSIKLSYVYRDGMQAADFAFFSKDCRIVSLTEQNPYAPRAQKQEGSILYACFENAFPKGLLQTFWQIFAGAEIIDSKWEYYVSKGLQGEWVSIPVMDETKAFSQSGLISFQCRENMLQTELFGIEGFWVRLFCKNVPKAPVSIKKIRFNSVKISQIEQKDPVYFTILPGETIKICSLPDENILSVKVYVKENKTTDEWVLWEEKDKNYRFDEALGQVVFGEEGMDKFPPYSDEPTIKIIYTTTQGELGNQAKGSVSELYDPIPFVDYLTNPIPTFGGRDKETLEDVIKRGYQETVCLNRCICCEDFEQFALAYSQKVLQAKCVEEDRKLRLVLLYADAKESFPDFSRKLLEQLKKHMPFYLKNTLFIEQAGKLEISVHAKIHPSNEEGDKELLTQIEKEIIDYLDQTNQTIFKQGFGIGEYPSPRLLREYLLTNHKGLQFTRFEVRYFFVEKGRKRELSYNETSRYGFLVSTNGIHEFVVEDM